jgi:hypothetical protein
MCLQVMTAESAVELIQALERQGAQPCLGGGWLSTAELECCTAYG